MRNFFNLVKIQIISNLKLNKLKQKSRRGKVGGSSGLLLYGVFMVFLFGFIGYNYTETNAMMLSMSDKLDQIITIMIAYSALISFFFSFYSVSSVLFNFKDYDILISMPIKKSSIVLSKLIYTYVVDFLISLTVIIGCLLRVGDYVVVDITLIATTIALTVIAPLFALSCSIIIGTLFALIASRFKKKNIVQIILFVLFFVFCFSIGFISGSEMDMTGIVSILFFIYPWVNNALNGSPIYLLYVALVCFGGFSLLTALVCVFYEKINAIINARKTSKKFVMKEYHGRSEYKAVLKREFGKLFGSAIYAMNTLFGSVFSLVIFIVMAILSATVPEIAEIGDEIASFAPLVIIFMFGLTPTTYCSVSMEGKAYWIYKTCPIKEKTFFGTKLAVNYIINLPVALICSLCMILAFKVEALTAILFLVFSLVFVIFGGAYGLFLNILFPNIKWENENQVVKQSMPCALTILTAIALCVLYFVLMIFVSPSVNLMLGVGTGLFAVISTVLLYVIFNKGQYILDKRLK